MVRLFMRKKLYNYYRRNTSMNSEAYALVHKSLLRAIYISISRHFVRPTNVMLVRCAKPLFLSKYYSHLFATYTAFFL